MTRYGPWFTRITAECGALGRKVMGLDLPAVLEVISGSSLTTGIRPSPVQLELGINTCNHPGFKTYGYS